MHAVVIMLRMVCAKSFLCPTTRKKRSKTLFSAELENKESLVRTCHFGLNQQLEPTRWLQTSKKFCSLYTLISFNFFLNSQTNVIFPIREKMRKRLQPFVRSYDWLVDWLIIWLIDWLFGWLIDKLIDWLIVWLVGRLIDWWVGWLIDWLIINAQCGALCAVQPDTLPLLPSTLGWLTLFFWHSCSCFSSFVAGVL